MAKKYTRAEAMAVYEKAGKEWTPEVEANLRKEGMLYPYEDLEGKPRSFVEDLSIRAESEKKRDEAGVLGQVAMGLGAYNPGTPGALAQTPIGKQFGSGAVTSATAGNINNEMIGVPAPTNIVERTANLVGSGAGVAIGFIPGAKLGAMAGSGVARMGAAAGGLAAKSAPVLQSMMTPALGFGLYNAAAPAENLGERFHNFHHGARTGAVLGGIGAGVGALGLAGNPVVKEGIDLLTLTGLGIYEGLPKEEAFYSAIPQLIGLRLGHAVGTPRFGLSGKEKANSEAEYAAMMREMEPEIRATAERLGVNLPSEMVPNEVRLENQRPGGRGQPSPEKDVVDRYAGLHDPQAVAGEMRRPIPERSHPKMGAVPGQRILESIDPAPGLGGVPRKHALREAPQAHVGKRVFRKPLEAVEPEPVVVEPQGAELATVDPIRQNLVRQELPQPGRGRMIQGEQTPLLEAGPEGTLPTGVSTPRTKVAPGGYRTAESGERVPGGRPERLVPRTEDGTVKGRPLYGEPVSGDIQVTPEGQGIAPQQRGPVPPSEKNTAKPENIEKQFVSDGVRFDQERGIGSVPDQSNVNYMGYTVFMTPGEFLRLNPARPSSHPLHQATAESIKSGEPIASPFLEVSFDGGKAVVRQHEGRGRAEVLNDLHPDALIPVNVFGRRPFDRAKHLTEDQVMSALEPDARRGARGEAVYPRRVIWNGKEVQPRVLAGTQAELAEMRRQAAAEEARLARERTPRLDMAGMSQLGEATVRAAKETARKVLEHRKFNTRDDYRKVLEEQKAPVKADESPGVQSYQEVAAGKPGAEFGDAVRAELKVVEGESIHSVSRDLPTPHRDPKTGAIVENPTQKANRIQETIDLLEPEVSTALKTFLDKVGLKAESGGDFSFTDPLRKLQQMAKGMQGSIVEKLFYHTGNAREMAAYIEAEKIGETWKAVVEKTEIVTPEQQELAGRLIDMYNPNRPVSEFLAKPEVAKLITQAKSPRKMLEYVQAHRQITGELRDLADEVNRTMGGKGIGYLDEYLHKMAYQPGFFEFTEKWRRVKARKMDIRERVTSLEGEEVANPAKERRTSKDPEKAMLDKREVPREWNAEIVLQRYVDGMLKSITGDLGLRENLRDAAYVEAKGFESQAQTLRHIAYQRWNYRKHGMAAGIDKTFEIQAGTRAIKDLLSWNKRMFDQAKYRFNPRFTGVTQWTSLLPHVLDNPFAALKATRDAFLPEAREFAANTWETKRKSRPQSSLRNQAEGTGSAMERTRGRAARTADKVADAMTDGVESFTNKFSTLIDMNTSTSLNYLTPNQRALSAGQQVFKRQSAYTFGERAPILNSRIVQGLFPAQSYGLELANQIREAMGQIGIDTRNYGKNRGDQAFDALRIFTGAVVANVWRNYALDKIRGVDDPEMDIMKAMMGLPPWLYLIVSTGDWRSMPNLPAQQIEQVRNALSSGNVNKATAVFLSNWGGKGGTFAGDLLQGRYLDMFGSGSGDYGQDNSVAPPPPPPPPPPRR